MRIIFTRAKAWYKVGSKVIAESEKREYSHVALVHIDETTGIKLVYQASLGIVNCYNYELFLDNNIIVEEYLLDLNNDELLHILRFLHENLGKPYSTVQIILLSIKKLLKLQVNYRNSDNAFICSELVIRVLQILKPDLFVEEVDYKTPSDLNKIINELNIPKC